MTEVSVADQRLTGQMVQPLRELLSHSDSACVFRKPLQPGQHYGVNQLLTLLSN